MSSEVLFASMEFDRYEADATLPAKFSRLIDRMGLEQAVKGRLTALKMHLGSGIGYTTVHPLFVKILLDRLRDYGAQTYITDQNEMPRFSQSRNRGYSEDYFGVPITPVCGVTGKYVYEEQVDFKTLQNIDIGGNIRDAEVLIDFSHIKGHGTCGYAGACKNIAMGCVTDRTRQQIHGLEGGLRWDEALCAHCGQCIESCNHHANSFDENGRYEIDYHGCTYCQHCAKVCPTGAIHMDAHRFGDFQKGMALCTKTVLDSFEPRNVFFINFLMNVTAICDCWGMSTPALVPDIGIMASQDIVAIEKACLDAIKVENLILAGVPKGQELGTSGHLFTRLHGKDPFIQVRELEEQGLGTQDYYTTEIK
ncbi:MAG: DUF362 domain-containing protein [Clostridia bacterium]|nr:DUF362 domain-containing protein [Clostridia bacterium]